MTAACTIDEIVDMIATSLPGVDAETATQASGAPEVAWGDHFIYYDLERILKGTEKFPFATIVIKDYPGWHEASDLNRDGVFRLNLGVAKATFDDLFPTGAVADYTCSRHAATAPGLREEPLGLRAEPVGGNDGGTVAARRGSAWNRHAAIPLLRLTRLVGERGFEPLIG